MNMVLPLRLVKVVKPKESKMKLSFGSIYAIRT